MVAISKFGLEGKFNLYRGQINPESSNKHACNVVKTNNKRRNLKDFFFSKKKTPTFFGTDF